MMVQHLLNCFSHVPGVQKTARQGWQTEDLESAPKVTKASRSGAQAGQDISSSFKER